MLGKAAKPCCFKNLNMKQLPVIWQWNRTSWMTASLFGKWLAGINNSMIKQSRKILLFIDHAPRHNSDTQYSNITLKFFPPNTTSKAAALNQGIIKNFKCYYRQQLVKHVIFRCAVANSSDDIVITALDAAHWTKNAWQAVTQSTICNTFRMAGFVNPNTQNTLLTHITIGGLSLTTNEFIEIDSETPVFNEWNDTNDNLMVVDADCGDNITTDNNEDDDMPTKAPLKVIEAMYMVRRLHILAAI
ncbi:unnamed protein product [Rotaria magnacalcarata]|uniref:DDE-1 domain-containing protein n=1 Tax=Rotaria magnacalcarata TaxID=392030 RepID=A0A816GNA1_9BILA|nr:unnamed protein product [Rotaria magnacalcarata]CAF1677549.1 unnamed protein product [Rotaria magnacalcarata]CAF2208438.1 unnamed protein product [Rotaria magnacalcarata]CAF3762949.1 unnamed protein product [Rotaria magnacalcarata]CAF3794172.1 unnamed protein product [Rotaria magnacalcarata]